MTLVSVNMMMQTDVKSAGDRRGAHVYDGKLGSPMPSKKHRGEKLA
jgi:hypothetical protein